MSRPNRPADISRCYTELRKNGRRDGTGGLSETSVEHTHRALHAAFEHAARSRLIARNVADDVIKPKRGHVEMHVWTPEQLNAWLASVKDHRLYPLWLTAATTGARRGELLGLQWDDIDLDAGQLAIRRSRVAVGYQVHETTPKSGWSRTVALDPQTVALLKDWRPAQRKERMAFDEGRFDGLYVFSREDGAPLHPHQVADAFDASVRRAKVPTVRFHDLRHGWATMALRQRRQPQSGQRATRPQQCRLHSRRVRTRIGQHAGGSRGDGGSAGVRLRAVSSSWNSSPRLACQVRQQGAPRARAHPGFFDGGWNHARLPSSLQRRS